MSRRIDLTGQRFGKLLVESIAPKRKSGNQYVTMWNCVCDCGNKTVVRSGDLRNGKTITCGNKRIHSHRATHGMCGTRIYNIWVCMKTRCNNISDDRYGGRGISVCEEWKDDFQSFYDWSILNGYEDNLTIERKDVNGNYCPENCCWIPLAEQGLNKRNNVFIEINGEIKILSEWSKEYNIPKETLRYRVKKGMSENKLLKRRVKDED